MRSPTRRAVPFVAALVLAVPATADAAAPRFLAKAKQLTPVEEVSNGGGEHTLVSDQTGNAVAMWSANEGIRVAQRPVTSSFSPATLLDADGFAAPPSVAVADNGTVVAVWRDSDGANVEQAFASVRAPGASAFSAPVQVSAETVDFASVDPVVAVRADGRALVAWRGGTANVEAQRVIRIREVSPAGVPLGAVQAAGPLNAQSPTLAMDDAGNAVIGSTVGGTPVARFRRADGTQEGDAFFTGDSSPTAIFDDAGNAYVARRAGDLLVRTRPAGENQVYGDEENLTPGAGGVFNFDHFMGVDAGGRVTIAWLRTVGTRAVQAAVRPAGAAQDFSAAQTIEPAGAVGIDAVDLGVGADGSALVTWERGNRIFAASRAPGATEFGAPTAALTPAERESVVPQAAMAADGRGMISFSSRPGAAGKYRVEVLPFDDVPRITASIPAAATVGQPAPFSASVENPWAPTASVQWAFGDGGTSTDSSTSHAFAAPGTPVATFTATDADGNTASTSGPVVVVAAPVVQSPAPPSPGGTPPVGKDTTRPVLSLVSLKRSRFRPGSGRNGSAVRFTLSEKATVTFQVRREVAGRRKGKACVAPAKAAKKARRCVRTVRVGTITRAAQAKGRRAVSFTGRVGGRNLEPGRYRMVIVAKDAAGNRSKPVTRTVTVLAAKNK